MTSESKLSPLEELAALFVFLVFVLGIFVGHELTLTVDADWRACERACHEKKYSLRYVISGDECMCETGYEIRRIALDE